MKALPKAPSLETQSIDAGIRILSSMRSKAVREFVAKANREYYHWEEVRRRLPPEGLTTEEAWHAVYFSRMARIPLPFTDGVGKPFAYWLPDHAQQVLHTVDRLGGGTLGTDLGMGDGFAEMKDRVLIDSLMEEAIATSQIEGAVTTRKVAKDLLRSGRPPSSRSERMIVNGFETIRMLHRDRSRDLSIEMLHEIQTSMTRETLDDENHAGRFRGDADKVHVVDVRDNEVVFTPPAARSLGGRLKKLIEFANRQRDTDPFIHPLVKASILHFWLAYEHPYCDGNGRTARALFYWSMLRDGYWLFEYLTISRIIHNAPRRYYRSFLHVQQDNNDLTYFLMFQLDVTRRALGQLHDRVREISAEQQRMRSLRVTAVRGLNSRQRALLDHALRHPNQIYTFESHGSSHAVNNQTARNDMLSLLKLGLLDEIGGKRPREFAPSPKLEAKLGIK